MKYRINPKNNEKISLLGFGAMRLPTQANGQIDVDETVRIMRYAIDNGVNYLDTAYLYHGGTSENAVAQVVKDGYREKVTIATKLPLFMINKPEDMMTLLQTQLDRLEIDYIDYYLAHGIKEVSTGIMEKYDVAGFMKKMKEEGKIRNMGFSYHGETSELFKEIIDSADWDFCQIQFNYMDAEFQAGVEGLKYAASKGIPVVIMEPLRGGKLTEAIPESIQAMWDNYPVKRTPAEWAFRWVANFPEVTTILSGMGSMEQVVENVKVFTEIDDNCLNEDELELISKVEAEYNRLIPYGCTSCKYCIPCPAEIDIPEIVSLRNEASMYGAMNNIKGYYSNILKVKASACLDCKACEEQCPQHLPISQIMKETAEIYE